MRVPLIILTIFLIGCSPTHQKNGLFESLNDQEAVEIYLSSYNLDLVPADIGQLKKARRLYITQDSVSGWKVYPPMRFRVEIPPFRQLPDEITELVNLKTLGLIELDLNRLPDNFDKLENLDSLDLFLNKLTISKELEKLKKLKNLKYLVLTGNLVDSADILELRKANPNLIVKSDLE